MKAKKARPFIEPERRRSLKSWRLWAGVALAFGLMAATGNIHLLWRFNHPWALPAALVLGHLLFGLSLMFSRFSFKFGWYGMLASFRLLYRPYGGVTLLFYFLLALSEELLFRALPLTWMGGAFWQVPLLALAFSLLHLFPLWRGPVLLKAVDLFVFGLILGFLYLWLEDFWPLVAIHWVRNAGVAKIFIRRDRLGEV